MVDQSYVGAKYQATIVATYELVWIQPFLEKSIDGNMCDNQEVLHIASNSVFHED